jgi:hypothetical protein
VSILERVVLLITEAVVEATAAGGRERGRFLACKPISAFTPSHHSHSVITCPYQYFAVSILEGMVSLITKAVVVAIAACNCERRKFLAISVADLDLGSGSGAFLTPGSGIGFFRIRISNLYF